MAKRKKKDRKAVNLDVLEQIQPNTAGIDIGAEEIYVCVPMEEGIVRGVRAFVTEGSAKQAEEAWLAEHGLTEEKRRDEASDWGTGIAVYECDLKP